MLCPTFGWDGRRDCDSVSAFETKTKLPNKTRKEIAVRIIVAILCEFGCGKGFAHDASATKYTVDIGHSALRSKVPTREFTILAAPSS
jgi:hypothetical protein